MVDKVKVVFVEPSGRRVGLNVSVGTTCMEAARLNDVKGIVAECGGSAACGTCHVYVDEAFLPRLAAPSPEEHGLLECTSSERRSNSRLSCQIPLSEGLAGIVLTIPDTQV